MELAEEVRLVEFIGAPSEVGVVLEEGLDQLGDLAAPLLTEVDLLRGFGHFKVGEQNFQAVHFHGLHFAFVRKALEFE